MLEKHIWKQDTRFKISMAVKIQVEIFWVVIMCCVAARCRRFGETCCLLHQGEGGQ